MQRNSHDRYLENLNLVFHLSDFFMIIHEHDRAKHKEVNPSARAGYMNPKFEPTFQTLCKLLHHSESSTLNIHPAAKVMNEFSEMLISSGAYKNDDLSGFWAATDRSDRCAADSARFKKMGASTLSRIVADSDNAQRGPRRPGNQAPKSNRPKVL